jgi:RNA polymerase sigma factor (sigma-70 family)
MGHTSTSRGQRVAGPGTFASFYEVEVVRQVRTATLILGSKQAAQDVVHDVFTEILQRWDGISDPGPYLQRAVVNRCRDALRRRAIARRHRSTLPSEDVPAVDAPLYDALATLPFKHRTAVVLRYYLGLTEAEIAGHLGCSTGSVGPWIRRGLDRLATELRPRRSAVQLSRRTRPTSRRPPTGSASRGVPTATEAIAPVGE